MIDMDRTPRLTDALRRLLAPYEQRLRAWLRRWLGLGLLSDRTIYAEWRADRLLIEPFIAKQLQPASYDFRLGQILRTYRRIQGYIIDPMQPQDDLTECRDTHGERFMLLPKHFCLVESIETFGFPNDIAGQVVGRSSIGRLGTFVENAGWCDPGWVGTVTMELFNAQDEPIWLYPGMKIAQMTYWRTDQPVARPYGTKGLGSKYQHQRTPTASRIERDFLPDRPLVSSQRGPRDR